MILPGFQTWSQWKSKWLGCVWCLKRFLILEIEQFATTELTRKYQAPQLVPSFQSLSANELEFPLFQSEKVNSICLSPLTASLAVDWLVRGHNLLLGSLLGCSWRVCQLPDGSHFSDTPLGSLVATLVVCVLLRYARSSGRCTGAQSCARSAPAKGNPEALTPKLHLLARGRQSKHSNDNIFAPNIWVKGRQDEAEMLLSELYMSLPITITVTLLSVDFLAPPNRNSSFHLLA